MDKIVYDSLYKFLVSIGLVLIALPFLVLGLMYGIEPILVSQEEFDTLSELSKNSLLFKEWVQKSFEGGFGWISIAFCLVGVLCLTIGIVKWIGVQKLLDESQQMNNEKQLRELVEMSPEQVREEKNKEIEEDKKLEDEELEISVTLDENQENANVEPDESSIDESIRKRLENRNDRETVATIDDYLRVEEAFFDKIKLELGDGYELKRNMRTSENSAYSMDIVAISKTDKPDILYDIKYYKYPKRATSGFSFQILKNWTVLEEYERIFDRKAKNVLVIVTGAENAEKEFERFDKLIPRNVPREFEIKYLTLEQLGLKK